MFFFKFLHLWPQIENKLFFYSLSCQNWKCECDIDQIFKPSIAFIRGDAFIDISKCGMSDNWDNSPSYSQFINVNHYRSKHRDLAHNTHQALKGPKTY